MRRLAACLLFASACSNSAPQFHSCGSLDDCGDYGNNVATACVGGFCAFADDLCDTGFEYANYGGQNTLLCVSMTTCIQDSDCTFSYYQPGTNESQLRSQMGYCFTADPHDSYCVYLDTSCGQGFSGSPIAAGPNSCLVGPDLGVVVRDEGVADAL
jgi:hypothetical protein